jgi:hypothetical protein
MPNVENVMRYDTMGTHPRWKVTVTSRDVGVRIVDEI